MFQAFLQSQLQCRYHPDAIAALHARASRWYAAHDDGLIEAIQHALAAGETSYAVQLVEGHRHDLMNGRQWYLLERILTLFTSEQVAMHLELLLLKAWLADHYRRLVELIAILEQADALLATLSSNTRPPVACGAKCMPYAAMHYLFALVLAYQAQGQADKVQEVLDIAITFAVDSQNAQLIRECEVFQAELALRQGRLQAAQG